MCSDIYKGWKWCLGFIYFWSNGLQADFSESDCLKLDGNEYVENVLGSRTSFMNCW